LKRKSRNLPFFDKILVMIKTYLRFLSLVQALDSASVSDVDETSRHLLQLIVLKHAQGHALTVTDAMAMASVASPATIHRKLDALREAGLITQTFEGKNRRTKYLVPTDAANAYFSKLGQAMNEAASLS
jgi:DNA-binding MarR family transcriptional regulator